MKSPIPTGNKIELWSCSNKRAIFGQIRAWIISTNMFVPESWKIVFFIVQIMLYRLCNVILFKSKMETSESCFALNWHTFDSWQSYKSN